MTLFSRFICFFIRIYQLTLSSLIGRQCRFYPSCSAYMMDGVGRFGAWKGIYLGMRRILRCHPFNPGGFDPVPDHFCWFPDATSCKTDSHDTKTSS